jgi:hypothetical protein
MSKDMEHQINQIPGVGGFSDARLHGAFIEAGVAFLRSGMTEEMALGLLQRLYIGSVSEVMAG